MQTSVYEVPTPEGLVTITWGDRTGPDQRADGDPIVTREGAATVIIVGGLEILVDPDERGEPAAT